MIAFLHTSKVHIERFEALVRKYNKAIETKHYVNKELLDNALLNGVTDTSLFNIELETIRKDRPLLLICTCSTYGSESDNHEDVYRIDKPIIDYLVSNYTKIGLVYTANSTKTVSENLIVKLAAEKGKTIEIVNCDCSEYWIHFENGDFTTYEKEIAKNIKTMASKVDVIFLAQASMEGAKHYLTDIKKEVYTSPEFGIAQLLKKV
ncbi:hypothetical protein [Algibacter sp. 2305UL17-15]|uniref:hypothetical protein n=1 Tax=Algibacter sp. 2305UL17-15 TaxID=3231268 RepID=UPI00345984C4